VTTPAGNTEVKPVLGPQAKQAMRTDCGGKKRLKLLVLIAAYADAGEASPRAMTLCERLGIDMGTFDQLLARLQKDGFLKVHRRTGPNRRNRYELFLNGRPK